MPDFSKYLKEFDKSWNQKEANEMANKGGVIDLEMVKSFLLKSLESAYREGQEDALVFHLQENPIGSVWFNGVEYIPKPLLNQENKDHE